ncbi:MAG: MFS transporter [Planctomycetaceae bacterium]
MTSPHFSTPGTRPTRVRYLVLCVTFAMAFLLYLHRFCMSYAQQYIREDLSLSNDDLTWCFSAFFLTYALAQVPSGWLSDRYGARSMLTLYILVWSCVTATMGAATGILSLLVIRLAVGVGQAGAYPTAASLIGRWIPLSARGTASGFVAWGGRLGGGLAPVLTGTLIVLFVPLDTPPEFSERSILNAPLLETQLEAALKQQSDYPLSTDSDAAVPLTLDDLKTRIAMRLAQPRQFDREGLNALITSDAPLITRQISHLPLEREAHTLLAQKSLSSQQTARLNRLVLEAVFPQSVGKLYVYGWRQVMFTYGACGLGVAAVFWLAFRNRPVGHPLCNQAEVTLITAGKDDHSRQTTEEIGPPPIRAMLTSRSLWLMCVSQWGSNVGWVFLVTWLPRFLIEEHSVPLIERGWMCAIPLWVGWIGMLTGGRATDGAVRRFGLKRGRILPMMVGRFLAGTAYLCCLLHPSPWTLAAVFGVVAFSTDFGSASGWAYKQDVGGRHVGSIHGWANMWGNLGATVSPFLLNEVVRYYDWDVAFLVCALAFFIAGFACLGVDATLPIRDRDTGTD